MTETKSGQTQQNEMASSVEEEVMTATITLEINEGSKSAIEGTSPAYTMKARIICALKVVAILGFIASVISMIACFPIKERLQEGNEWIKNQGQLGYLIFIAGLAVSIVLSLPSTILEAFSGFVFGFWLSIVLTTIGKNIGACTAFFLGRTLGKDTVGRFLKKKFPSFKALSKVLENCSFSFLCLYQMAYIPMLVKILSLSILEIDITRFIVSTVMCGVPYTIFWSYVGSSSDDLLEVLSGTGSISIEKIIILSVGIGCGVVAMVCLARYTLRQLELIKMQGPTIEKNSNSSKRKSHLVSPTPTNVAALPLQLTNQATVKIVPPCTPKSIHSISDIFLDDSKTIKA